MTVAIVSGYSEAGAPFEDPGRGREDDPSDQSGGIVMLAAKLQSVLTCSVTWPGSS